VHDKTKDQNSSVMCCIPQRCTT